jgi:hypothetical protein
LLGLLLFPELRLSAHLGAQQAFSFLMLIRFGLSNLRVFRRASLLRHLLASSLNELIANLWFFGVKPWNQPDNGHIFQVKSFLLQI